MKLVIILILLFALATAWGAQNVYLGIRDRNLVEISCADYVAKRPTSRWVKLVDCEPDFSRTLERTDNGELDAVFVPLRPRGANREGRAPLVVETDGKRLSYGTKTFQGMMRIGFLDEPADSFRTRMEVEIGAAPNAVVLDLGGEPHMWLGLLALIGGMLGLGTSAWLVRRAFRS